MSLVAIVATAWLAGGTSAGRPRESG